MKRLAALVSVASIVSACRTVPPAAREAGCSPEAPADAAPVVGAAPSQLAGRYTLVLVGTAPGRGGEVRQGQLELRVPQPAERIVRYPSGGQAERALLGTTSLGRHAEVRGVTLHLGDPDTPDLVHDALLIQRASQRGFWGSWKPVTGGVAVVDVSGTPVADAAGYFCAFRVGTP